eukprot:5110379-Prorocentrum_lima.AAC.1
MPGPRRRPGAPSGRKWRASSPSDCIGGGGRWNTYGGGRGPREATGGTVTGCVGIDRGARSAPADSGVF